MKKGLITFAAAILFALCSCGGGKNYGEAKTKAEFEALITAAEEKREIVPTSVKIDVKTVNEGTGIETETIIGKFEGNPEDADPSNQEHYVAMMCISTFTYSYVKNMFSIVPAENISYYASETSVYTIVVDYSLKQTTQGISVEQSIKGTYSWNDHGLITFTDEVVRAVANMGGQTVEEKMTTNISASYVY